MSNETTKVKGQPIPHTDMHGCGYGMSDIYRCAPIHLGRHRRNQYNPKMSPKPIQACRSFPNIALFQTHTHTRTKLNESKQMKLNKSTKRTKSEQHRQYQSAAVFFKEVCINTIRCFSTKICLCLNFASISSEW